VRPPDAWCLVFIRVFFRCPEGCRNLRFPDFMSGPEGCRNLSFPDFMSGPEGCKNLRFPDFMSGPEGCRNLRFPDFITTAQICGKFVSLMQRPTLPPGNKPGTHFCWRLSRP
jgi:hypothetical protein